MKKANINVSGMKIGDIIDIEKFTVEKMNSLNRNDLARVVGRLVSASNKRLRNLEKSPLGKFSPIYRSRMGINRYKKVGRTYGYFTTKGKNLNQLRQLYGEARGFLMAKTSTLKGWEEVRNEITETLGIDLNTKRKSTKFWKAYREIYDANNIPHKKDTKSKFNSEQIQMLLAEQFTKRGGFNQKIDDVLSRMEEKIDELYEEATAQEQKIDVGDMDDGEEWEDMEN